MARTVGATIADITPIRNLQPGVSSAELPLTDGGVVEVFNVTSGMVDNLPRDQIPVSSAKVIKNGRVRDGWCGRREGTGEVGTKPDSNRIIGIVSIVKEDGTKLICRISSDAFHVWDGVTWTNYIINEGAFSGFSGSGIRVTASQLFEKMYFVVGENGGLWEVDFTAQTVTRVSAGPSGRFTVSFAERILIAHTKNAVNGYRPNGVSWSKNADGTDWSDSSAGSEDLIATELGNQITGLIALESVTVVVRRVSIVHISRQPFAIAPFRFTTVASGVGSDLPYTTVKVSNGIVFADSATRDVYFYRPGDIPRSLTKSKGGEGSNVYGLLYSDLATTEFAEATYDPAKDEYHLGLSWTTDNNTLARRWICGLGGRAPVWTYDDSPIATTIGSVLPPPATTRIDDLSGTINDLTGPIDQLSSRETIDPHIYAGTATGEVIEFSFDYAADWNTVVFEFLFQSQNLGSTSRRRTMKDLEVTCSIPVTGSVTIEQSKDAATWTNTKTASYTGASTLQKVRLPKTQITGDDLFWRIRATARQFKFYSWWARMMEKGLQVGGQQA
jgi:hypothetical protein